MTHGANNCFGSVGLKRHSYCVLNKQYAKDEYFELIKRIKRQMRQRGEYGRFFPFEFSPHYYNRCEANDFFPLNESDAELSGLRWWKEPEADEMAKEFVPDTLAEVDGSSCGRTFCCAESGRGFRLIEPEIELYRKLGVAPPDVAPLRRLAGKNRFLNAGELRVGACVECQAELQSVYAASGDSESLDCVYWAGVLCEACFQRDLA